MRTVEIPVSARPQIFTIPLANDTYTVRLYWLIPAECWVIDILTRESVPLICGIPFVTGTNLLAQFQHILKGILFVVSDHTGPVDEVPTFTSLGITGKVYYCPPPV